MIDTQLRYSLQYVQHGDVYKREASVVTNVYLPSFVRFCRHFATPMAAMSETCNIVITITELLCLANSLLSIYSSSDSTNGCIRLKLPC
jgi:hypothetical protein